MPMINRSVLTVKANEPFAEWLKTLPDPEDLPLEEINDDNPSFLLPEFMDDDEKEEILAEFYDMIFEEMLLGWWDDEAVWPQDRNLEMFHQWFDVEFCSMVIDCVDEDLVHQQE